MDRKGAAVARWNMVACRVLTGLAFRTAALGSFLSRGVSLGDTSGALELAGRRSRYTVE